MHYHGLSLHLDLYLAHHACCQSLVVLIGETFKVDADGDALLNLYEVLCKQSGRAEQPAELSVGTIEYFEPVALLMAYLLHQRVGQKCGRPATQQRNSVALLSPSR